MTPKLNTASEDAYPSGPIHNSSVVSGVPCMSKPSPTSRKKTPSRFIKRRWPKPRRRTGQQALPDIEWKPLGTGGFKVTIRFPKLTVPPKHAAGWVNAAYGGSIAVIEALRIAGSYGKASVVRQLEYAIERLRHARHALASKRGRLPIPDDLKLR